MPSLLVTGARLVTPRGVLEPGWLSADHGVITDLGTGVPKSDEPDEVIDAGGRWLLPGFVDVHVHGAMGHEAMDGDVDGLHAMSSFYASHGVTSFLATTWTASGDDIRHALEGISRACREPLPGARLAGAHLEGPYLSPDHPGAQAPELIRPGDPQELESWLATGVVKLVTIAPEIDDNLALVGRCRQAGVAVSAGHTDATYERMVEAVRHGVGHVTHTFNAMRPLHHREPGVVGAAMTMDELTVELIADEVHVHPAAMRALVKARGADAVVLVTDAMRAAGLPAGSYPLGDRRVEVADGTVRLPDGTLAGSVLTLDVALRNLRRATDGTLSRLWPTSSRNAARLVGVGHRRGVLETGWEADLVLVDDEVAVHATVVGGRIVHRAAGS